MKVAFKLITWSVFAVTARASVAASDVRLIVAAKERRWDLVGSLLKSRADVNGTEKDHSTALHWAAHWNDLKAADSLIEFGADPNATTDLGVTPLFLACENGSAEMVEKLLKAGAKPGPVLLSGESALMTCARSGTATGVAALLARGADANAKETTHNQTALMWAISQQHPDVVKILIKHGAQVSARTSESRQLVVRARISEKGEVRGGTSGVWIPRGGSTPLLFAARVGDIDCARLLLEAGADVNYAAPDGNTALSIASHSSHGKLAEFLLDKGADPNAAGTGYTALHSAVLRNDLELVQALLKHKANPNAQLKDGTPFRRGDSDGILPADLAGATPFFLAAKFLEIDIMQTLLAAGADPLVRAKDGTTPLMAIAGIGWPGGDDRKGARQMKASSPEDDEADTLRVAKMTIDLGCDILAVNNAGDTALHGAVSKGYTSLVRLLVSGGAKLEARNKDGKTPLALTVRRVTAYEQIPLDGVAKLLRELGATK